MTRRAKRHRAAIARLREARATRGMVRIEIRVRG